jgi:hypothetical protein
MTKANKNEDRLPAGTLVADGFDDALIGNALRAGEFIAVYDRDKCVQILREQFEKACGQEWACDEDHHAEAEEFFEYNTQRATDYLGDRGPVYVEMLKGDEQ